MAHKESKKEISTSEVISAELAAIDIEAAGSALARAEQNRQALLLTGDDEEILDAEREITRFRIARDRAIAKKADLERRLADAQEQERAEHFRRRYDEVAKLADAATKAIETEFPALANRIIEIARMEREADEALATINVELIASGVGLPAIKAPSARIWGEKFLRKFTFNEIVSLPETNSNPPHGEAARLVTMEAARAIGGVGQPPAVPAFQFR